MHNPVYINYLVNSVLDVEKLTVSVNDSRDIKPLVFSFHVEEI